MTSAAPAWWRRRRRTSATSWSWSIRPTIRRFSTTRAAGGPDPRLPLRVDAQGLCAYAKYDATIALTLEAVEPAGGAMTRRPAATTHGERRPLRYGENPHQNAFWQMRRPGSARLAVQQGKELGTRTARPRRGPCASPSSSPSPRCRHQAHQPVRSGDRRFGRPRPTCGPARPIAVGLRRHRRAEPAGRCDAARALTSTFIEAASRPRSKRGEGNSGRQGQHAGS